MGDYLSRQSSLSIRDTRPTWEECGSLSYEGDVGTQWASIRTNRNPQKPLAGRVALAFLFAGALMVSSVAIGDLRRGSAADATTLRIGMIEPIDSLNPFIGVTDNAYIFWGLIYDYLTAVDQDLNPKPNLAKSWYPVPDAIPFGSVWQYNLTHEAKWHDGEPFDADDVVFTIDMQIGLNFETVWSYQPYTALIQSIEKIDEYTVRIHFQNLEGDPSPCPFANALMIPIIPEHIWGSMSVSDRVFSYENFWPKGTGPFMCTEDTQDEFEAGDPLILLRNPDYHGATEYGETVDFDRLILTFYFEPSAMYTDIQRGAIDLAAFNSANYELLDDWLEDNPDAPIDTYAGLQCTGFSTEISICMKANSGNNLRLDPAVRQAMAYATDKAFINNNIYRGYAEMGSTIFSPVYGDYYWTPGPDQVYAHDLEKANQTLDAAGYYWGTDGFRHSPGNEYDPTVDKRLSFEVVIEEELIEDRDTFTILREDYGKVGIELKPRYVSIGQWSTLVYDYLFDLTLTYWSGDPDPSYLLYTQTSYCIDDWSENAYDSPYYDQNYSMYVNATTEEERLEYIHNCQELMYQDCAFIVYSYPYGCWAWRTDSFSGWGDWENHPGRQLANFWTSNPLYYDLVPLDHDGAGISGTVLAIIVAAVAVVVVAVVLLLLRRRGGAQEEDVQLP